jgi:glyoxylase-like metal-dependent hydrolase (beta-lactamase superfamily II)
MRVHHLNCGTGHPLGSRLFDRLPQRMVCHCLLLETPSSLVLVDTGLGTLDLDHASERLGPVAPLLGLSGHPEEPAVRQLRARGLDPHDVRHIVLTHLDLDHAGGLADFPHAAVHVARIELEAAQRRKTFFDRRRYRPCQWAHGPRWITYETGAERCLGLPATPALDGLPAEIVCVALFGHTLGHCGVAVCGVDGWLLHAGDTYYGREELRADAPPSAALELFRRMIHADPEAARRSLGELRRLRRLHPEVRVFSAHDPDELAGLTEPG